MTIGIIGLGHMGRAMAEHLLEMGEGVVGFDVAPATLEALQSAGGRAATSPSEVADHAETVIACLPNKEASFEAAFGADGIVKGARVMTYVEMSTLGRAPIALIGERLAETPIGFLDAPISGGPSRARAGTLTAIVAGGAETVETARGVIDQLATNVFVVGQTPGMAQVCKLVNNILSITAFVASCEAVTIGVKAGLDAEAMIDVINVSTGRNSATLEKFPRAILSRKFGGGGPLSIGEKDVELFLELARDTGAPAEVATCVASLFHRVADILGPETDYSRMITVFEAWAGGEVLVGARGDEPADSDRKTLR
ncbi:3-hydroxyisobutyrate dehydrogenase-like beta-hydroxyacid dehydrogenase [Amorphus suaedae]